MIRDQHIPIMTNEILSFINKKKNLSILDCTFGGGGHSKKFLEKFKLKEDYDLLIVDFHGEITSEKNAIGHFFDGKATLVIGTHTHIPTNDARVLPDGTAFQTDAGMCGDYDSVIGMNKYNSLNRFMKKDSVKHFPAKGDATLCGVIVDCDLETGLASKIKSYIYGDLSKNKI